jgi:hypothetical protein
MRVLWAAELCALSAIGALIVGLDPDAIHDLRNEIDLPVEARDPEGMNDVVSA